MHWSQLVLVTLLTLTSISGVARAENDGEEIYRVNPTQDAAAPFGVYVPVDLNDTFKELSRMLHPKLIERIKSGAENDLYQYHLGLGMWMRNNWALWKGSRLSEWFNQKGIHEPDEMSGIILDSFWRHLNSRPIELDKQIALYEEHLKKAQETDTREKERAKRAEQEIAKMMMGMSLDKTQVARVSMPDRSDGGLRARYLARFRSGVLMAIRKDFIEDFTAFTTPGYFLDLQRKRIHPIKVPEIDELQFAVVAGGVTYFSGSTRGKPTLVSVDRSTRSVLPLPVEGAFPQLGIDGMRVLVVYKNSIYALEGKEWSVIYRGDIQLPRSGPPPQKSGNRVFFRDEGRGENWKRLWWLELTPMPKLVSLAQDMGVVVQYGPRWENSFSYCLTQAGDLWATLGEGNAKKSLVKRSAKGTYSLAITHNSVQFDGTLLGGEGNDDGLSVSAVSVGRDGTVLAAGDQGLYTIQGKQIKQLLAIENTKQEIPIENGKNIFHWGWDPSDMLELGGETYLVAGAFGGIYLISRGDSGKYTMTALDETLGEALPF